MKTKKDAKTTVASANGQESNELVKPKRSKRAKRQIIIYVVIVVAIVGILGFAWADVDGRIKSKVLKHLRDKYKQEFVVTDYTGITVTLFRAVQGRIGTEYNLANSKCRWLGEGNETHDDCNWSVHPKGNPKGKCMVSYSDGAMRDSCAQVILGRENYAKARQISAEEDRLRPAVEQIFGKNTKFGVESLLCEKGRTGANESTSLPQAINVCKKETAGMTKDQISDSYIRMYHSYELYIYDPDGQSIETDGDKAKIVERLKEVAKYLPEGRPDSMWLCYFIKHDENSRWNRELKVSVDYLREMTDGFSNDGLKLVATDDGKEDPYPIRKGWDK
ncbi:hypothetical protein [Candidatus Nanoperiomorbus periodonticus]|uniref:hypothetical protein n=1 Tax=Candidatus Nanoperiomorbus periodonticus TaxID=2171989 RepID=UPI00101C9CFA|nr:hypothetical protein [Candidatus Nanoperiomorbus periodonticus]RYC76236.1 hypothetical protein G51EAM_00325 [Candidatus Nanoperiomorbus periodonticus]